MVGFLVTILKILGFLLLGILGLLLVFILVVLLCPLRYECSGIFREERKASGKITWLFSVFHIPISWDEDGLHISLKILGIDWSDRKKKKEEKAKKRKKRRPEKKTRKQAAKDDEVFIKQETAKQNHTNQETNKTASENQASAESSTQNPNPEEEKKQRIFYKINGKLTDSMEKVQALQKKLQMLREKLTKLGQQKDRIIDFFDDEEAQKAKSEVLGIGKKALRHVLPYELNASIRFGMEEPDKTGQILAVSSFFYGIYGDRLSLEPDFENQTFEGEFYLKGKIRLLNCVSYVINLYRIKKRKEFITLIKNL